MIYEVELPIEAYKNYLNKSYVLIEEIMIAHQNEEIYYKMLDEISHQNNETLCRSFQYDINETIITTWHSSSLIGIISIFEKGIQEYCNSKERNYKKRVENFKKEFKLGSDIAYIEILWKYIEHK